MLLRSQLALVQAHILAVTTSDSSLSKNTLQVHVLSGLMWVLMLETWHSDGVKMQMF